MKALPVEPAQLTFDRSDPAAVTLYNNAPQASADARHATHQALLAANDLPRRWRGKRRFVVLETGFGLGGNFLSTWAAWRADAQRCDHLDFVSLESHPLLPADLAQVLATSPWPELAQALLQQWPPLTPHLHALRFDQNRVSLLLVLGDAARLLPALQVQADAVLLDGWAPTRKPPVCQAGMLRALGRKVAPGATLAANTSDTSIRNGLNAAGFVLNPGPPMAAGDTLTGGHFQPRYTVARAPAVGASPAEPPRTAVVVGAGLAGAAAARALAQQGLQVTVLEGQPAPATRGSGNPAGLFHGTVNADDGPYARLFRTAALAAQCEYTLALTSGNAVAGSVGGLLRLELRAGGLQAMQALLTRQGLPADYVQALTAAAASSLAGVPLPGPAWYYPGGGWISPPQWVAHALSTPGVSTRFNQKVAGLRRQGPLWQPLDAEGQVLAQADVVVLAHTQSALALLQTMGHAPWPVSPSRGQVSHWPDEGSSPRLPVAGDGYALRIPSTVLAAAAHGLDDNANGTPDCDHLMCGATQHEDTPTPDETAAVTDADHHHNLTRLQRLTGMTPNRANISLQGRAGWRLGTADRLPIAGAVPCVDWPAGQRQDQARLLPRETGLFVLTALGARGLTWAPLLAQLVAAQACGAPWPLEQDLADAIDPARWRVRAARQRRDGASPANR